MDPYDVAAMVISKSEEGSTPQRLVSVGGFYVKKETETPVRGYGNPVFKSEERGESHLSSSLGAGP